MNTRNQPYTTANTVKTADQNQKSALGNSVSNLTNKPERTLDPKSAPNESCCQVTPKYINPKEAGKTPFTPLPIKDSATTPSHAAKNQQGKPI